MAKTVDEVEDFLHRHVNAIEKAMRPKPLKHTCRYPPGRLVWTFDLRFPFVHVRRRRKCICLCEINQILSDIKPGQSRVINVDVEHRTPAEQLRIVQLWRTALRNRRRA